MSHVDDAAHLRSTAIEKGLRVRDTKSHPAATRFVISLEHEIDTERLYVHASPNKISITIDLTDGATEILSYEQALERIDPTLDDIVGSSVGAGSRGVQRYVSDGTLMNWVALVPATLMTARRHLGRV